MHSRVLAALPFLLLIGVGAPLSGQEPVPDAAGTVLGYGEDRADRMTVAVSIDGQGPFRFVVDTGAERTVIAQELAGALRLAPGRTARIHSMTEVSDVATVVIPDLEVGGKTVQGIHAPALLRRNLGAEGMLGVDSLQSQRVSFDFRRKQITVAPSRRRVETWPDGTIVIKGRSRFGRLVLVDAEVDGQKVWVIVDTGSEVTIANSALRRKLESKQRLKAVRQAELVSVTGGRMVADQMVASKIRIGGMNITRMPITFADAHPFRKLDLIDRPALLLGMDVLKLFDRVSVDFANRQVRMLAPGSSQLPGAIRLAAGASARPIS